MLNQTLYARCQEKKKKNANFDLTSVNYDF